MLFPHTWFKLIIQGNPWNNCTAMRPQPLLHDGGGGGGECFPVLSPPPPPKLDVLCLYNLHTDVLTTGFQALPLVTFTTSLRMCSPSNRAVSRCSKRQGFCKWLVGILFYSLYVSTIFMMFFSSPPPPPSPPPRSIHKRYVMDQLNGAWVFLLIGIIILLWSIIWLESVIASFNHFLLGICCCCWPSCLCSCKAVKCWLLHFGVFINFDWYVLSIISFSFCFVFSSVFFFLALALECFSFISVCCKCYSM